MAHNITKHIERKLEEKSALHKESVKRWNKDHPLREPGTSLATWKTYSRQKYPSQAFRDGFAKIDWSK